jgi:hypothetical protein
MSWEGGRWIIRAHLISLEWQKDVHDESVEGMSRVVGGDRRMGRRMRVGPDKCADNFCLTGQGSRERSRTHLSFRTSSSSVNCCKLVLLFLILASLSNANHTISQGVELTHDPAVFTFRMCLDPIWPGLRDEWRSSRCSAFVESSSNARLYRYR